jgi:hypothetical protein
MNSDVCGMSIVIDGMEVLFWVLISLMSYPCSHGNNVLVHRQSPTPEEGGPVEE